MTWKSSARRPMAGGGRVGRGHPPDVVVMDVRMPVMDGIEATRRINSGRGPDRPRVLILTTFDLDEYVFDAMQAGASGFTLKSGRSKSC